MNLILKTSIVMMLLFSNNSIKPPVSSQNIVVSNEVLETETTVDNPENNSSEEITLQDVVIDGLVENEGIGGTLVLDDESTVGIVYLLPENEPNESLINRATRTVNSLTNGDGKSLEVSNVRMMASSTNPNSGHKVVWDHDPGYGYGTPVITVQVNGVTRYLYCIEPYMAYPTGQSYSSSEETNSGIKSILTNGFPSDQLDLKSKYGKSDIQAYVATFIAHNAFIGKYSRKTIENAGDGYVNELLKEADKGFQRLLFTPNLNNSRSIYNSSKKRLETESFISIAVNRNTTRTFTVSGLPSGIYVVDESGNRVTTLRYNQKFKLATDNLKYDKSISFSINHSFQDIAALKFNPSSNVQPLVGWIDPIPSPMIQLAQTFTPALGSFELTKLDENGNPVKDVTFRIRNTNYKTDANGKIKITDLDLGEITYQETAVPNPIIIDTAIKKATITAGANTSVIVTNQIGKGIIEVAKQAEDGKNVANVGFEIKDSLGKVVSTLKTGADGKAKTGELSLGSYTVTETSVPKEYILNTTPQTVTLNYKDSKTRVVTSSTTFTNKYQPIGSVSVERIRIDTKKAEDGLDIEGWFSKDLLYDYSLNDFRNAEVRIDVLSLKRNDIVASKTYTIETFPEYDSFHVESSILEKNTSDTYTIQLSVQEEDKVTLSSQRTLDTEGHTATEAIYQSNELFTSYSSVIRTERYFGQSMLVYNETFDIEVPKIQPLRAGRGYAYDTKARYRNDLDQPFPIEVTLIANNGLVDGQFYERNESESTIPLTEETEELYQVPKVYARKDITGDVISEEHYQMLSNEEKQQYRDGGHQVLTPIWNTDVGTYPLRIETNKIGVNESTIILSNEVEIYAYMYGHFDADGVSKTIKQDETIVSPISIHDGNGNGIPDIWDDGSMPDNFGVTLADGSRVLTLKEKEFFSVLGSMTLSYDLNGGQGSFPAKEVVEGEQVKLPDKVPSRNGYLFDGWLSSSDGKLYKQGDTVQVIEDTKLIAQWKQHVYTVTFNLNGGSGTVTSQSVAYGAKAAQPTNPTRTGYAFTGWSPDINQAITKDTTFTAQWKINQYKVTYDANGGVNPPASIIVDHGTSHTIGKAPTRTGYTFAGWKNISSGLIFNPGQTQYIVNNSVTFQAQWTTNQYNVSFNLNGGSGSIASQSVSHGSKASVPTNPTRTGYTFTGWSPAITNAITANTTFTAQWKANTYTVTYNANGGTGAPGNQTFTFNSGAKISTVKPTRAGYTFSHWLYGSTKLNPGQAIPTGWGNFNLTAQWTAITETWSNKSLRQSIGNYTVVTYYTPVYQGTLLKRIDYEVVAYKSSGSGYWSYAGTSSWLITIANQTRSGTFNYDFRGQNEIRLTGGTINVNSTSFTNSASFRVYLDTLGTFSGSGNLNK